jgi:hypothetical protein
MSRRWLRPGHPSSTRWATTSSGTAEPPGDPFGTAAIRRRVLDAWRASPARFREDANAEEDLVLGSYRDRLVVELAQNAADAAAALPGEGVGRLWLTLRPATSDDTGSDDPGAGALPASWVLVAANTGQPLDAAGVEALATLRASAKRDVDPTAMVGRFGVGFAAVLAVTDRPALRSRTGGVGWSRSRTAELVAAEPALAAELERRSGSVPVLRLPWPDPLPPPDGFDSAVVLPLSDQASVDQVRDALAAVDAALLLMLPALTEVTVDDGSGGPARVLLAADLRVTVVSSQGRLPSALLAGRPVEERSADGWWVRWAYPRPPGVAPVLHAPTPTDEPVELPALLLGSFPLEPSRRHVAGGPLADHLVAHAAAGYVDLVRAVADRGAAAGEVLDLVPSPVPAGPLDARVRQEVLRLLPDAPLLPGGLRPVDAVVVDGLPDAAVGAVSEVLPGLLPPDWARARGLAGIGVRRLPLADLVDELASVVRPVAWWRELYDALAGADAEALSALPVPLADGRLARGPRGVVLGAAEPMVGALGLLGVRAAATDVGRPELLLRLGAVDADPRGLLEHPAVRAAAGLALASGGLADGDLEAVGSAVLELVRASGAGVDELGWLASVPMPDDEGGWAPAGELVLPGSALAAVLEPGALGAVDGAWVARWGVDLLAAAGALASFALVRDEHVALDPDSCDHDLDEEDVWVEEVNARLAAQRPVEVSADLPGSVVDYVAVRDLELVASDRWPEALQQIATDRALREAVLAPTRVLLPDGRSVTAEPYTAWWLRTHPVLAGQRPDRLCGPGTAALAGLLDEVPDTDLDQEFLAAIGVVTSVAQLAASPMELPLVSRGVSPAGAAPDATGTVRSVPAVVDAVLPTGPRTYVEHDELTVAGVSCEWWVDGDGDQPVCHAATTDGLARSLAWAAGRWDLRLLLAAVLADPARVDELVAEDTWR